MKRFVFLLTIFFSLKAFTQTPSFPTSGDIYLGIKKLNVLGSVLYMAAHPDDENTRLLTYFSKDKLYRTGYLSLTRGDGGQNLIGDEQGVELGLIRTQELLSARRIDGAEQFFSRAFDFGYSKSPEETFTKWDREKILSDVVWVIRKFQPDVIITRFPTTGEGGHGQHTASAILAVEAFRAAADPKRFPEQLKYVQPWQAKRLLWNTFNFGSTNTTSPDQFKLDAGDFNPVLGKSYGEIAAESRSQHKSQGFGVPRSRGEAIEYFKTLDGDAPTNDLHDGVDIGWSKAVSGGKLKEIQNLVNSIIAGYDFSAPQKSVVQLVKLYTALKELPPTNVWAVQKTKEVTDLIAAASGLWLEAYTTVPTVVQGDSVLMNFALNDRAGVGMTLKRLQTEGLDSGLNTPLLRNKNVAISKRVFVQPQKELTQPYWLKETMHEGYFEVNDQRLIGEADVQKAFIINFTLTIDGHEITISRPLQYKYSDAVKGELYQPLFVLPPATVTINPSIVLFRKEENTAEPVVVQFVAQKALSGKASPHIRSQAVDSTKTRVPFSLAPQTAQPYVFNIKSSNFAGRTNDKMYASVLYQDGKVQDQIAYLALRSINYDHIPAIKYFYADAAKILNLDLKTEGKKIGYIIGAGDKVPAALEQMGYEVTLLTDKELARINLKQFDAVIAGVRSFNANDWMGRYYDKLMKYVQDGGNYIVQYSQNNNIRAPKIGPYNFTVSGKRITDENATVTFLSPDHPVLNFPNKITQADFNGWIQERSIYHADAWDSHYEPIFRMNDPGEAPHDGSLIITKYGKGFFTYTGLVFFRELPAGVPGAYRLIANLIALNKIKGS